MKPSTLNFAKQALEAQRIHSLEGQGDKAQQAYYEGMKAMLEIILTEAYTKPE